MKTIAPWSTNNICGKDCCSDELCYFYILLTDVHAWLL